MQHLHITALNMKSKFFQFFISKFISYICCYKYFFDMHLSDVIKNFFGIRKKLSYEERVRWFVQNFYETGMEYDVMLMNMKDEDLDNFKWYDDFIKIPKYKDEI